MVETMNVLLSFLNPFDWLGVDGNRLSSMLDTWGYKVDPATINRFLDIATPLVLILGIIGYVVWRFVKKRITVFKWRKLTIEARLGREFASFMDKKNRECYVRTKFQLIPPDDTLDPIENQNIAQPTDLLDFYINNVLVSNNTSKFLYCVLAGSGMGKTTFSVNLLIDYVNSHTEGTMIYDIQLLSLSNDNVIKDIEKIPNHSKTILILDALDENTEAVTDFKRFIPKLEEAVKHFYVVIVTCRTQFFSNATEEPRQSKLTFYGREKNFQEYTRHYISFFDDNDIDQYLKKKYHTRKSRKKAKQIVTQARDVMVRPLLLSYIDDLLEEKINNPTLFELYQMLIDKWLDREVNNWNQKNEIEGLKEKLYDFSNQLAVDIYQNKAKRGGLFITREEFEAFLKEKSFQDPYSWSGRSLINRDSEGYIKFSHKSFLEFFLAKELFYNGLKVSFEGMDVVEKFYKELCIGEFMHLYTNGIIDYKIDTTARSLMIYSATGYNLEHLKSPFPFTILALPWNILSQEVASWIENFKGLQKVIIFNYTGGAVPHKILNLSTLRSVMILGDTTPNDAFMKKAKGKKIAVNFIGSGLGHAVTGDNINELITQMDSLILFNNKYRMTRVFDIIHKDIKFLGNEQ